MVWKALCYNGLGGLEGAERTMDVQYYTTNLSLVLIPVANDVMRDVWTLQQDNAQIHTVEHTRNCLEDNAAHILN